LGSSRDAFHRQPTEFTMTLHRKSGRQQADDWELQTVAAPDKPAEAGDKK
jgi:hypothetical protein